MGMFDEVLENVGEPFKGASKGFEYGTHEVILMQAEGKQKKTKANDAAEVIEVTVADEDDEEKTATCTLYFHTEGGAKMSVAKVLGILVHNVGEDKKDTVRELGRKMFGSIDDPVKARNVAVKLLNDKMIGKKAYLVAEPQGRYKTTSYGDLWHYPAEPQGEPVFEAQAATKATGGAVADITEDELPEFGDL
jgi:hypothetical protein